jgi:hypothetical protein
MLRFFSSFNFYTVAEQLIEETSYSDVILPSPEWRTLDHIGKNARITYRLVYREITHHHHLA